MTSFDLERSGVVPSAIKASTGRPTLYRGRYDADAAAYALAFSVGFHHRWPHRPVSSAALAVDVHLLTYTSFVLALFPYSWWAAR